jgi:hypothetical protein
MMETSHAPDFRADCRWIAEQARVSVDEATLALARLLRLGFMLVPDAAGETAAGYVFGLWQRSAR